MGIVEGKPLKLRTTVTGKLTALDVKNAKEPGLYGDGGGLWLRVQANGTKTWAFRYKLGKAREMGLGPLHTFSLAEARDRARNARQLLKDGKDPIEVNRDIIAAAKADKAKAITFKECAERYIETHKSGWKNAKHLYQWKATLKTYAYPVLGDEPVNKVNTALVLKVIEPLWSSKTETASRLRGRIEKVLDWARVRGHRHGENPARLKGHIENALPKLSDMRKIEHHPALPYAKAGAFMADLRKQNGIAARALEFTVLTTVRTNEAIGAKWPEIDLEKALWSIPPERMKARKSKAVEHRVPLSKQALAVLKGLKKLSDDAFVFPGASEGNPLSNMAMLEVLRRMGHGDISVHGFRSTFRDWASEQTAFPREVCEMALAHTIKNKAEAAYRRGDLLDKRAKLMSAWADYCDKVQKPVAGNVVQLSMALA